MSTFGSRLNVLKKLEAEVDVLSIDQIADRLGAIFQGLEVTSPIFDAGVFVYRARKVTGNFNTSLSMTIADLKYPPAPCAPLGRANRQGRPMFYCALAKEPIFFELGALVPGDELIVTNWKTNARMFVNNIGYTQAVFARLGATRPCPTWVDNGNGKYLVEMPEGGAELLHGTGAFDENQALRMELSRLFMRDVQSGEQDYKLTAAIAEAHLGSINETESFAGIIYPSVRMWANGDNLALTESYVDRHLEFKRATRVRIDRTTSKGFEITYCECARDFDEDGRLLWLGRPFCWQVAPNSTVIAKALAGPDVDGEYSVGRDGVPTHWVVCDRSSGEEIKFS